MTLTLQYGVLSVWQELSDPYCWTQEIQKYMWTNSCTIFENVSDKQKEHAFVKHDGITACAVNNSITTLHDVFAYWVPLQHRGRPKSYPMSINWLLQVSMSHHQPNAIYLKKNQYKVSLKSFKKPLCMFRLLESHHQGGHTTAHFKNHVHAFV
jgi:hypothetical protein